VVICLIVLPLAGTQVCGLQRSSFLPDRAEEPEGGFIRALKLS
jgi:hypothetical protein